MVNTIRFGRAKCLQESWQIVCRRWTQSVTFYVSSLIMSSSSRKIAIISNERNRRVLLFRSLFSVSRESLQMFFVWFVPFPHLFCVVQLAECTFDLSKSLCISPLTGALSPFPYRRINWTADVPRKMTRTKLSFCWWTKTFPRFSSDPVENVETLSSLFAAAITNDAATRE